MNLNRLPLLIVVVFSLFLAACSSDPTTCEICGYQAVNGDLCQICNNTIWDESTGQTKEEYLREKQIIWFTPVSGPVEFYEPYKVPKQEGGGYFLKDTINWNPVIAESDVEVEEVMSVDDILGEDPFAADSSAAQDTTSVDSSDI